MAYTDIDKPSDYMRTQLWSGNNSADREITWSESDNMQPNWIWVKRRSDSANHRLADSVRGATKILRSDTNGAETTESTDTLSFDTNGFSVGNNSGVNKTGDTYVGWGWKAGTALNNSAGSNNGSIASTGSFSTTAGFSIVKWSGSNSAGTIYTGLSGKIDFVILKNLSTTRNWIVKPKSFAANDVLYLQETNATVNAPGDGWINALTATNGTIGLVAGGSNSNPLKNVNENNANYIAYCFQEKQGYSKFGSYKGNGNADGSFVYTGFKPAFVIVKRTDATNYWFMFDDKRSTSGSNPTDKELYPNGSEAEDTSARFDFLSNGFKNRINSAGNNASGGSYIYMAFSSSPFTTSSGVPATAR